jgi:hypothetical protein
MRLFKTFKPFKSFNRCAPFTPPTCFFPRDAEDEGGG